MKKKKKSKKVKAKKKNIYNLYIYYNEVRSGGEETDPGQEFSSHEPEYIDFTPIAFYHFLISGDTFLGKLMDFDRGSGSTDYRHYEVEFDPMEYKEVYAVIVRYTTGDTFGTTHGAWEAAKIVTNKQDAEKIKKDIEKETGDYDSKKKGYHAWKGYFESLESVVIHKLDVIYHA